MKRITKSKINAQQAARNPVIKTPTHQSSKFMAHLVHVCWLNSHSDTSPRHEALTVAELARRFATPQTDRGRLSLAQYHALNKDIPAEAAKRKAEKNGAAFIPATFTQPNKRTQDFVAEIHAFVLDFDGMKEDVPGVTRAEFEAKLVAYGYLAHTSYSHRPDDERWRVVLPYSMPCTVEQHAAVYAYFCDLFQGRLDDRSETTQQLWYTPACPYDGVDQYQSIVHDAALFDPYAVPVVAATHLNSSKPSKVPNATGGPPTAADLNLPANDSTRLSSALPFINADGRKNWVDVGMALKNQYGDAAKSLWHAWSKGSSKYDEDDAETTWDSFHPMAQGGVTVGTIYHLAQAAGWSPQLVTQPAAPALGPLQPLFDIKDARVDRFMRTPAPKREWLFRNTLPFKKVGLLVAPGGTGKSFFTIQAAVAIATKTRLADLWEVDNPGATLILCAEEDETDLHHRLRDVVTATVGFSPAMQQLIEQRVFIKSMLTENNLMTDVTAKNKVEQTDYVARLILTATQIPDLRLIVIDPASRFQGGDELSARDATRFVEALECLRSATGATVLLVHHATKASMNSEEVNQGAARGSSALTDGARWQMNLGTLNKTQAKTWKIDDKDRHQYVLATITKNNGAPPQPPVLMQRGPGGVLGALAPPAVSQSPEERIATLLLAEAAAGRTYTLNGFDQKFSGTTGELGLSSGALRKLVSDGIKHNYLTKRTTKPVGHLVVMAG